MVNRTVVGGNQIPMTYPKTYPPKKNIEKKNQLIYKHILKDYKLV